MSGFRGLTFEKSLKAFGQPGEYEKYVSNKHEHLQDMVYRMAKKHLKSVESCCSTDSKFCCNDIWQGNLMEFVQSVIKEL